CNTTPTISSLLINIQSFAQVNAGADQYVCSGTTFVTLAGTISGAVTGNPRKWDWVQGSENIPNYDKSNLNARFNIPAGAKAGDIFTVSIKTNTSVANCTGVQEDIMQIHIL